MDNYLDKLFYLFEDFDKQLKDPNFVKRKFPVSLKTKIENNINSDDHICSWLFDTDFYVTDEIPPDIESIDELVEEIDGMLFSLNFALRTSDSDVWDSKELMNYYDHEDTKKRILAEIEDFTKNDTSKIITLDVLCMAAYQYLPSIIFFRKTEDGKKMVQDALNYHRKLFPGQPLEFPRMEQAVLGLISSLIGPGSDLL